MVFKFVGIGCIVFHLGVFLFGGCVGHAWKVCVCIYPGIDKYHVGVYFNSRVCHMARDGMSPVEDFVYSKLFWKHCGDPGEYLVFTQLCVDFSVLHGAIVGIGVVLGDVFALW